MSNEKNIKELKKMRLCLSAKKRQSNYRCRRACKMRRFFCEDYKNFFELGKNRARSGKICGIAA